MKNKRLLTELFNEANKLSCEEAKYTTNDLLEMYKQIEKELEILEFIKKHYVMNGFNELIPIYLDNDDGEKFNELEKWLENEK